MFFDKGKLKENEEMTFEDMPEGEAIVTDQWDMYADVIVWYRQDDKIYFCCANYEYPELVPAEEDTLSMIQLDHGYVAAYQEENEGKQKKVIIPGTMTIKEYYNEHYLETYMTGSIVGEEVPAEQARELIPEILAAAFEGKSIQNNKKSKKP